MRGAGVGPGTVLDMLIPSCPVGSRVWTSIRQLELGCWEKGQSWREGLRGHHGIMLHATVGID